MPELLPVVNEGALRRLVGGSATMRAQLSHLLEASHHPQVTLQLVPFNGGAHAGMNGAFTLLSFPEPTDPDIGYVSYNTGNVFLEKPEELARLALIFNHLRAAALSVSESRNAIFLLGQEL